MWAEPSANTEDVFVEITVPANVYIRVVRVASNGSNGQNTSSSDTPIKLLMKITSTAVTPSGTFGALTIIKRNPYTPTAQCTVNGKIATGASATAGTLDTLLDQVNYNPGTNFEWVDSRSSGFIVGPSKYFVVSLAENNASGNSKIVSVTWEEI